MDISKNKTVGIIGCGIIADTHIEAIKKAVPDADICLCDVLPGKAELLRRKYDLKSAYTSLDEMLSSEIPYSVHILTPPQYHVENAYQCIKAGAHVFVEKPLAFKAVEAEQLYNYARQSERILCVDHSLLCQPSVSRILEVLKSDKAGKILYFNCFYGNEEDDIIHESHWKRKIPGGPIVDALIHPISLAVSLTGKPKNIKIYSAEGKNYGDEAFVSWIGENGIVSITISGNAKPFRRVTEITTSTQTLIIDHSTETSIVLEPGFGPKAAQKVIKNISSSWQLVTGTFSTIVSVLRGKVKDNPGTRNVIEKYYAHIGGKGPLPISEESVLNATSALEEIIRQLEVKYEHKSLETKVSLAVRDEMPKEKEDCVLVSGASGLLGRHLCEILSARGRMVKAQVRRGQNADKIQSAGIKRIFEDFYYYSDSDYDHLVEGVNDIIHCAHASGAKTWEQFKKINVDATVSLYRAAWRAGCKKFIYLSSAAVYGVHQKGKIVVNEETPTISGHSNWDFYIRSKTMAEEALLKMAEDKESPKLLILRPGPLYTRDGIGLFRKSVKTKDGRLFIIFGNGSNHQPYTRVDILARTIADALEREEFPVGIYNVTGNPDKSVVEFITNYAEKKGLVAKFIRIPVFPIRIVAGTLEFVYSLTGRKVPPKVTRYIIDSSARDVKYDTTKAKKDLAWDEIAAIQ